MSCRFFKAEADGSGGADPMFFGIQFLLAEKPLQMTRNPCWVRAKEVEGQVCVGVSCHLWIGKL